MPYGDRRRKKQLHEDWTRWSRPVKERLYLQYVAEEAAERARELESQGWRAWYSTIFGEYFTSNLAPHHIEALEWHWNCVLLKRAGLEVPRNAYPAIWSRGHRKSDLVRHIVVADACLLGSGYCLYVSSSKGKVHEHALSIGNLIGSDGVREYYPQLSQVSINPLGQQRSWTSDRMITASGYTFHFVGLMEGVAGANVDGVRPGLIVGDDLDEREDSPVISQQRMKVFTRSVLATRQFNTIYFIAQNYISRHGVVYQIHTGKVPALNNQVRTQPIPAFRNLVTEQRTIDGRIYDIIVGGEPTWPFFDAAHAQSVIDDITFDAFQIECQHLVDEDKSGVILPEYNDAVHCIGWSEFNTLYGLPPENREVPTHWKRYISHDWGSTPSHHNVVAFLSVASANSQLAGTVFMHRFMSFPPSTLAGTVAIRILNFVLKDEQADHKSYIELALLDRASADPSDAIAAMTRRKVTEALSHHHEYVWYRMSHEAKAVRDIYRMVYGLPFLPTNPRRAGGVEQMRHYLRTDYNAPHPFRSDTLGFTRMFLVVEDSELTAPKTDAGMALAREQLMDWRWRPEVVTTKGLLDERPLKTSDDLPNALMLSFVSFSFQMTPLTNAERIDAAIPPHLRYDELLKNSPFERGLRPEDELAFLIARSQARKKVRRNGIRRFYNGQRIN